MAMNKQLQVTSHPHIDIAEDTRSIMLDVIIALSPALVLSIFYFGFRSLILTLVSTVSCIVFEFLYRKLMKKSNTIGDLSAVITGMLIAFNLPVSAPYWMAVVGAAFAIIVVKQLYGGLGKNFMNPALAQFSAVMAWHYGHLAKRSLKSSALHSTVDVVTSSTPLASLKAVTLPTTL